MRGKHDSQVILFAAASDLEQRIRADHPLRAIKGMANGYFWKLTRRFDAPYADQGRPSAPPERLIKELVQSISSIRSEAQLIERIDQDLLFRCFLDLRIDESGPFPIRRTRTVLAEE